MDGYDLSKIPAVTPPAGVVPNFVDPPTQKQFPQITTYVTLPLMAIFLALRLYTRIKVSGVAVDDYLCILSAASIIVYIALCFRVIEQAAGPHMWDIPVSKITVSYAKNTTTLALIYFVAAMFIKTSILTFYSRIFRPSRRANILLWCAIVISVVFYLTTIAVYLGTCLPRSVDQATGGWLSPQFAERTYGIEGRLSAATGIVGTVIDFYILGIPLVFLWSLQMSIKRKIGLSAVFVAGSAACIFSVAGAVYRMQISSTTAASQDLSWKTMPIYAMSIAEINIGIMCSCMPIVFVVFKGFPAWSASWITKLRYMTPGSHKQSIPSDASNVHMVQYKGLGEEALPSVPKGTMSGVKSLFRSYNRTRPATQTMQDNTELLTVRSMDLDYHAQLKQQHTRGFH